VLLGVCIFSSLGWSPLYKLYKLGQNQREMNEFLDEHGIDGFVSWSGRTADSGLLRVSVNQINAEQARHIADKLVDYERIIVLQVSDSEMTDQGLHELCRIESVRVLTISNCPELSDQGMAALVKLKNLSTLHLFDLNLSDSAVEHLEKLPPLSGLSLEGSGLSFEARKELRRHLLGIAPF